MEKSKPLSAKQQAFILEYTTDLNATQAAIRAGYSVKTARQIGEQNLSKIDIQNAIQCRMKEREKRVGLQADEVLRDLKRIVFFDPRKLFDDMGNLKPIGDLDDDTALVLTGYRIKIEADGRKSVEIKWADKLKAIESAMRHLGLYNDRLNIGVMSHEDALAELE